MSKLVGFGSFGEDTWTPMTTAPPAGETFTPVKTAPPPGGEAWTPVKTAPPPPPGPAPVPTPYAKRAEMGVGGWLLIAAVAGGVIWLVTREG